MSTLSTSSVIDWQDRPLHVWPLTLRWCNTFKTSNEFISRRWRAWERKCLRKFRIYLFCRCIRCRVLKTWRLRNASVSFISISRWVEFWKVFFLVACSSSLWLAFFVTIFFFHTSILQISCFWFLNWIEKFLLSIFSFSTSLSLQYSERRLS